MAELKTEPSHIVIKIEAVQKYLTTKDEFDAFIYLLEKIDTGLTSEGKNYDYAVVNSDEPYYDKVLKVILDGEDEKASNNS